MAVMGPLVVTLECLPDKGSGKRVKLEVLIAVNQIAYNSVQHLLNNRRYIGTGTL